MPERSSKKKKDLNVTAFSIMQQVTGQSPPEPEKSAKNAAAVALGRLGGLKGGKARAANLSKEKRSEIAKIAANQRWKNIKQSDDA